MGAPGTSKITKGRITRIAAAVRRGLPRAVCASAGGINRETLRRWLNAGRNGSTGLMAELVTAVESAEADLFERVMKSVERGIEKDPWLALRYLAMRFPTQLGAGAAVAERLISAPPVAAPVTFEVRLTGAPDEGSTQPWPDGRRATLPVHEQAGQLVPVIEFDQAIPISEEYRPPSRPGRGRIRY